MSIFKAYDIRGVYPKELDEKIIFDIGSSFASFNPGKIAVGCDVRLSSPSLKKALIDGLLASGADVVDVGTICTPIIFFATRHYKCNGGIMVTASHNPSEYNGLKIIDGNAIPISYESGIGKIEELVKNKKFAKGSGKLVKENVIDSYSKFLLDNVNIQKANLKVVIDAGNGSTGQIYPLILEKLGVSVHKLYCEPDGNFPNHQPDPTKKENLKDLQEKVKQTGADFGIGYDGDGDRVAIVDERGEIVENNKMFAILVKSILSKTPQSKIIYDILCSKLIEDTVKENNGVPLVSRVGHTYISQRMIDENALFAGELSGHYYFRETKAADDALFATLKLIEHLVESKRKLSEMVNELPTYHSDNMRLSIAENEKLNFVNKLKEELCQKHSIDTLDGVKVNFENGWALFRPSNTEPKISIAYEATSPEHFQNIKSFVNNIVKTIPGE